MSRTRYVAILATSALWFGAVAGATVANAKTELTFWSHWAAEVPKRSFVEKAIADFERPTRTSRLSRRGTKKPRSMPR